MTPDEQRELETLEDMFTHPGWALFMEDFEQMLDEEDTLSGVNDTESLFLKKGRLSVLTIVTNYPEATRRLLDDAEDI